ncbi:MAG: hypothetical protein JWO05_773 [Gemmatimonadetes bacterium]|nr:hypothetical protein [Gemmatimonadota bacterium]
MKQDILRIIAASELLGGIFALVGYALVPLAGFHFEPAWQPLTGIAFGAFAMACGIGLFRGARWGVPASISLQVSQLASFSVASHFRYVALAGPLVRVIVATTGVRFEVGGGGAFIAVPGGMDGTLGAVGVVVQAGFGFFPASLAESGFTMGVNLVAAYFLWRLAEFVGEPTPVVSQDSAAPNAESGDGLSSASS